MKIVVLDGYTLNPGDLDWSELKSLGEVQIHERSAPSEIAGLRYNALPFTERWEKRCFDSGITSDHSAI